ncbi:hypothetical protein BBK82_10645 [Lentzea guizhouensis]|uniref:Uncharacterized protein n=1 Tax=Lentzea guizhouensis TaxID=1586287 RepID=A0A1B2HFH9_9PSEU|nr:hypothetical protein BBK82_10645 [Lentzea guizhouensis]
MAVPDAAAPDEVESVRVASAARRRDGCIRVSRSRISCWRLRLRVMGLHGTPASALQNGHGTERASVCFSCPPQPIAA